MPSLLELQERFAATLESRGPAASPGHGIYREAIGANYRRALAATYRAVRTIVGAGAFDAAVDGYVAAHPPLSGDLNIYGGDFAAFLEGHVTAASCPWLADLARVEWAVDEAARSADATMTPAEVVAALSILEDEAVEDARLVLHPSCRLLESTYNVYGLWSASQDDRGPSRLADTPSRQGEFLLVRRHDGRAMVERLGIGEFSWLRALHGAASFADALAAALADDPAFDLGEALSHRVHDGTVGGIDGERYNSRHG